MGYHPSLLHLHLRNEGPNDAVERLKDGTPAIFITTRQMQLLLKLNGARRTGKDYDSTASSLGRTRWVRSFIACWSTISQWWP